MLTMVSQLTPEVLSGVLGDDEISALVRLERIALAERSELGLSEAYYLGDQVIQNLRIAVPKELEFIRTIVGWPAVAVDPLVERLAVDGFRLADGTEVDDRLAERWHANGLDAEFTLASTDALSLRKAYWLVGTGDDGAARVTVESPLNMAVAWDKTGRRASGARSQWIDGDREFATVMVPRKTVTISREEDGDWELVSRDEHDFDFVPVVRMANRPRASTRDGRSEISAAIRSVTDAACRTLLGLEVARELFSAPRLAILGAREEDFQNPDGTPKNSWSTYITRVLGLEVNEDGTLPDIKQLQQYDPTAFTKLVEMYASQASGLLAADPRDLGLYTDGNPVSAEAGEQAERRRDDRARLKQKMWASDIADVLRLMMAWENGGVVPPEFRTITVDWADLHPVSLAGAADGITKLVAAGVLPPESDVTLKRAGFNAVERRRLEQDRREAAGKASVDALIAAASTGPAHGIAAGQ